MDRACDNSPLLHHSFVYSMGRIWQWIRPASYTLISILNPCSSRRPDDDCRLIYRPRDALISETIHSGVQCSGSYGESKLPTR